MWIFQIFVFTIPIFFLLLSKITFFWNRFLQECSLIAVVIETFDGFRTFASQSMLADFSHPKTCLFLSLCITKYLPFFHDKMLILCYLISKVSILFTNSTCPCCVRCNWWNQLINHWKWSSFERFQTNQNIKEDKKEGKRREGYY